MRLFVYGTLLDADLRRALLGPAARRLSVTNAVLKGYRRVALHGGVYPALRRDAAARVDGCVQAGTDRTVEARLTAYEGEEYRYARRPVEIAGLGPAMAGLFLTRDPPAGPPWSLADWQRRHKARVLRQLAHWRRVG